MLKQDWVDASGQMDTEVGNLAGREQAAHEGRVDSGPPTKNQAVGACCWLRLCDSGLSWVEGTCLVRDNVELRWWGCAIEWHMRVR